MRLSLRRKGRAAAVEGCCRRPLMVGPRNGSCGHPARRVCSHRLAIGGGAPPPLRSRYARSRRPRVPPFDRYAVIPRRPERVAARRGREPGGRSTPLDHRQDDPPIERPARQLPPRRGHALEERRLRLLDLGRLDVGVEGRRRPMVSRNVVPLPALLVEPEPPPRPRASHHAKNCPTARPYAARVLAFAIRPAKNSRNRATASGPASTISAGRATSAFHGHRPRPGKRLTGHPRGP